MEQILVGIVAAAAFAWFLFYEWPSWLDAMEEATPEFEAPPHWEEIHRAKHGDAFLHGYRRWWQRSDREILDMSDRHDGAVRIQAKRNG